MSSKRQKIARKWAGWEVSGRIRRARKDRKAPRLKALLARIGIRRPLRRWTALQEWALMRAARREYKQLTRDAAALKLDVPRPYALAQAARIRARRKAKAAPLRERYHMRPGAPAGPGVRP